MPADPERRRELKKNVYRRNAYTPKAPKVIGFLNKLYNNAVRNVLGPADKEKFQQFDRDNKDQPKAVRALNVMQERNGSNIRYFRGDPPPDSGYLQLPVNNPN